MPGTIKKIHTVYIHILVWCLYIACNILIQQLFYPGYDDYIGNLFNYGVLILVFYVNAHFIIERFGKGYKRIVILVILTVALLGSFMGLLYIFQQYISPLIYHEAAHELDLRLFFWASLYTFLPFLGFSYGYSYVLRTIRHQKEINALLVQQQKEREEKLQLAKERLHYEYSFLQAQINPHFLFNALNFFYSRTLPFSQEVSGGIMKLSEIMRYALENKEDEEGKVWLSRETGHVQNVIDINQLRYSNKLHIQFTMQGPVEQVRIIPLVLITLVENAFKYGDLADAEHPLQIKLCVSAEEKKLVFTVRNKKNKHPIALSSGIGMQNIRNRMQLAYKDNYRLTVADDENFYAVELLINL